MRSDSPSRTAAYMALFRAIESSRPADSRLFHDPLALAFQDRRLRLAAVTARLPSLGRLVPWYIDRRSPGPRPSGVVGTRAVDDAVREALVGGALSSSFWEPATTPAPTERSPASCSGAPRCPGSGGSALRS